MNRVPLVSLALLLAAGLTGCSININSGDDTGGTTTTTVAGGGNEPCSVDFYGGKARLDLSASGLDCTEAAAIYAAYQRAVKSGQATDTMQTEQIQGWRCQTHPFADYPLLVRCEAGSQRLDALGIGPLRQENQGTPAPTSTTFIQSPTGNIGCAMAKGGVRCDIEEHSWQPPPKPSWCPDEWGNGLSVGVTGLGQFTCAGDSVLGQGRVLSYNRAWLLGRFVCTSSTTGMRCDNTITSHGFFLSREQVRTY